jgi:class 3 adenylate cyclase
MLPGTILSEGRAVPEASERRFCPSCGNEVPAGARFCPSCGAPQSGTGSDGGQGSASARSLASAIESGLSPPRGDELRQVTALFADVVGSTSLGERLTPDEVKALIGECVTRMSRAVEDFGGIIQAYTGDGICAYFGVPAAHEDDPERAARAAFRILEEVGEYGRDIEGAWGITDFSVRIGINSGQTGVGMVGAADPQAVALGDTTNVAARLQAAAEPGTIAVGDGTAKRLGHAFSFQSLGDVTVKGRADPVAAWRLVASRQDDEPAARTPLVGREAEMARLAQMLDELTAGRGQILLISGEAGMGKTRMLAEMRASAGDRVTWLEARCRAFGTPASWEFGPGELLSRPFRQLLLRWLAVEEEEPEVAVRMKLRAKLGALLGSRLPEVLPFLARFLAVKLDPEGEAKIRSLAPEALAEATREAYRTWIAALASNRPVVLAVDDFHWAAPPSREMAESLLPLPDRAPVLVVAAFRPDPASEAWRLRLRVLADYAHRAAELPLPPLDPDASGILVEALVPAGDSIDEATKADVVARAEGNPLYLEELLRAMVEAGALQRRRSWSLSVNTAELLPPALESLLLARIDRLADGPRHLAQVAAVIGREFPVRVLERVAGAADVQGDLAALLRGEIIREVRRFPELEFTFKHGLMQEAALSTLTPARKRELYGRAAAAFEELFAGSIEDHLPLLAHYYAMSDDLPRAQQYLEQAGDRAAAMGWNDHAVEMWKRARKVAGRLDDAEAQIRLDDRLAGAAAPEG